MTASRLTFASFSIANAIRCQATTGFNHPIDVWDTSDWFLAMTGELGEAANIAKKLNRIRNGINGNKETEQELRKKLKSELADIFIYLDLLAQHERIDLEEAIRETWNAKSEQIGYSETI